MELEALRTKLAEHRANAERISKDEAAAREQLATISKAAKAAAGYANEKAIFAEIDTSPEAKATAEKATATYATALGGGGLGRGAPGGRAMLTGRPP